MREQRPCFSVCESNGQGENHALTPKRTKVGKSKPLPRASRDDRRVEARPRGVKRTFAYYVLT